MTIVFDLAISLIQQLVSKQRPRVRFSVAQLLRERLLWMTLIIPWQRSGGPSHN